MNLIEIIIGIPLALIFLFIVFRVASVAIFISWWRAKYWSMKEHPGQEKEKEEKDE